MQSILWVKTAADPISKMIVDIIRKNRTLQELLAGIVIFGLIGEVVVLVFPDRLYHSTGFITGVIVSLVCAVHMAWSVDVAVMLDEKTAITYSRKYTIVRYIIMCAVLAVLGITDIASPVTLIIGYMGLKIGAYLNPFIHKYFSRRDDSFTVNKSSGGEE